MRTIAGLALALAIAAPPAVAQDWKSYAYPDAGFSVEFPAPPTITSDVYAMMGGRTVPSRVYIVREPGLVYSVTVADFSQAAFDGDSAIDQAIKMAGEAGDITSDAAEIIDQQRGHDVGIAGQDGSRIALAVFFVGQRLYVLRGVASAPDAASRSASISRFQQTLSFLNSAGKELNGHDDGPADGPQDSSPH